MKKLRMKQLIVCKFPQGRQINTFSTIKSIDLSISVLILSTLHFLTLNILRFPQSLFEQIRLIMASDIVRSIGFGRVLFQ